MRQKLLELLKEKAYQKKQVKLSSGKTSNFYIDVRKVSLTSEGIHLIASLFFRHISAKGIAAIGGPSLGADPLVAGVCFLAGQNQKQLSGFLLRKAAKGHGNKKLIEGPKIKPGSKVVICDDVATSGKSLLAAKRIVQNYRLKVVEFMVVVDRCEGARELLAETGCGLFSLFQKKDFLIP